MLHNPIPRQTNSKTQIPSNASQVYIRSYGSYTRPRICVWSIKRKSKSMLHSLKAYLDLEARSLHLLEYIKYVFKELNICKNILRYSAWHLAYKFLATTTSKTQKVLDVIINNHIKREDTFLKTAFTSFITKIQLLTNKCNCLHWIKALAYFFLLPLKPLTEPWPKQMDDGTLEER